jgi:hypothetical protein
LINFVLQGCSEEEFKVYMSERFNKALHSSACSPDDFDDTATSNLLMMVKKYHKNENQVYTMIKFYVYHTYMVLFHKINKENLTLKYNRTVRNNYSRYYKKLNSIFKENKMDIKTFINNKIYNKVDYVNNLEYIFTFYIFRHF